VAKRYNNLIKYFFEKSHIFTQIHFMSSIISEGVMVSVEVFYQPEYSNPLQSEYMFAYRITLENFNSFAIKLLRRNWYIFDSNGIYRQVEGEGVVGVQPIIAPGENYQYMSGCNLKTEMGKMKGTYKMENQNSRETFEVLIPEFEMVVPAKEN
jgi:ApaG protein